MKVKKIIIISALEPLRDFFRLEALNFGFSVDCFSKFESVHNDLSSYDLSVIDRDTVKQAPLNGAKRELTVSSENIRADIYYPMLISELREIYNDILRDGSFTEKENFDSGVKIVFYKDEKNLISVNDRKYILSDTEYKIFNLLCENSQQTVLREEIQRLFENGNSNIGDVYICKLRKKLEVSLGQRLIFTVREKGYKILTEAEWR